MLIIGWTIGLAAGLVLTIVYGAPLWMGFLVWSLGGAALTLAGFVGLHLLAGTPAKESRQAARVG
ncbi:hypothetical protein [Albidovulum sediminis]|uniref:CTP synthetase n=1 Tax=Albidovulum sediminis TaxID=3066345 RepID=A0ABT2NLU3_9RHOB|nr:hypothetical protein [Defluviimonas sediminis]MCT8329686.1 hypothetical protein [Defluviimonas sediminis]